MKKIEALFWVIVFYMLSLVMDIISPFVQLVAGVCALLGKNSVRQWGINCWEGKDNFVSAQFGGDPDESISSRLGKAKLRGSRLDFVANKVDLVAKELFNDTNHSVKSIETDEGKKQVTGV
jgi:hypothetical protein